MMAKKTTAAAKAKKSPAAAKARPAAAKKAKAAPAKKGAGAAAKKRSPPRRVPSLQIVSPPDGGSATRSFPVKCKGTGLTKVDVTIARTGLTKKATLTGGFWVANIAVADI